MSRSQMKQFAGQPPFQLGNPRKGFLPGMGHRAHQTPGVGQLLLGGAKETSLGTDWWG